MHMADALISVPVASTFWAVSAGAAAYSSAALKRRVEEEKIIPFMGVMGALVFALQMVNFTIPATGSSGHFAGGFLLALLLGSEASFLIMSSVLLVQALFFADGGLLALGCNIFNIGFIPAFIVYPLFKKFTEKNMFFIWLGAFVSLLAGAAMVSIQTALSGISELPFSKMFFLMMGIHVLIGIVEGLITVGSFKFISLYSLADTKYTPVPKPYIGIAGISLIIAGIVSLFASENPDGLEWSVFRILGNESEPHSATSKLHDMALSLQSKISILPDYNFSGQETALGTSVSGIVGVMITIFVAATIGYIVSKVSKN